MDLRVDSLSDTHTAAGVIAYLKMANFHLTSMEEGRPLLARVAQFPHASIVHFSGPAVEAVWTRDALSADRVLLIVSSTGPIEVSAESAVITRDPQLALVTPGTDDVQIRLVEEGELFSLGVPSGLLADVPLPAGSTHVPEPLDPTLLRPLVAFLGHLCRTETTNSVQAAPLQSALNEIVRAIAMLITMDAPRTGDLHGRAMEIVGRDFADPALSATRISTALGVAVRTLQLSFQREGQTLAGQLRRVRAHAAHRSRAARPDASMASIAASSGFGSESAMFRALREFRSELQGTQQE